MVWPPNSFERETMIKLKNIDKKSALHKLSVPVVFHSASSLSAGYLGHAIVPFNADLEKIIVNPTIDATGSNGTTLVVTNEFTNSAAINQTVHSQVTGQLDWSANSPRSITATSDKFFSAGCPVSVTISGTVGVANIGAVLVFDLRDKEEK